MHILRSLVLVPLLLALACSPGPGQEPPAPGETRGAGNPGGAAGGEGDEPAASEPDDAAAASDDPNVAKPAAEIEGECRPRPNPQNDLVARLRVVNTGNIGVNVRVAAKWPQPNGALQTSQRARVEAGETLPLTLRIRTDRGQGKLVNRAVDDGRTCRVTKRVLGAFGLPGG